MSRYIPASQSPFAVPCAFAASAILILVSGCSSAPIAPPVQPAPQEEFETGWRAVPQSEPVMTPAPQPGSTKPARTGSAQTELVNADMPVIEPLRTPLSVTPSVAELSSAPRQTETPAVSDADLPVVQMNNSVTQTSISDQLATNTNSAEINSQNNIQAPSAAATVASAKSNLESTVEPEPVKAVVSDAQSTTPKSTQPIENAVQQKPETEPAVAVAAVSKAEEPAAASSPANSDVELMCTEVISGVAIGSDTCGILDGSVAGLGFVPESADLTDSAKQVLDSVADVLLKKPNLRVSVSTYSNDLDDSALGKLLARRRTLAVIRQIISNGVEGVRVRPNNTPVANSQDNQSNPSEYLVVLRTVSQ